MADSSKRHTQDTKPRGKSRSRSSTAGKTSKVTPQKTKFAWFRAVPGRIRALMGRRPHRSFHMTRRRDYRRSLKLPGYWAFTATVIAEIRSRKSVFLKLALVYTVLIVLLGGATNQEIYNDLAQSLRESSVEIIDNNWGSVAQAGLLAVAAFGGSATGSTETQQLYLAIVLVLVWLATVWLLREQLAGRTPKLRDALYQSAAPLVATALVVVFLILQLIPLGIFALAGAGLSGAGLLTEGFSMYLFSVIAILVLALTLYWVVGTLIGLVVVTLPGMYPMRAMEIAGDLVVGRRLRIALRFLWMISLAFVFWISIMIPAVLLNSTLSERIESEWYDFIPVVPLVAALLSTIVGIWMASYVYLLYRKVVDDDASPA